MHKDSEIMPELKKKNHFNYNFKERKFISSRNTYPKCLSDADPKRNIELDIINISFMKYSSD